MPRDRWPPQLQGMHVVTIGGGTGPFALLSALKRYPCVPTAVVTMTDSGGSSRRLMDEFGQLPVGDLRQALVALSRKGALWRDMFAFRFPSARLAETTSQRDGLLPSSYLTPAKDEVGLGGHSLGNLILCALQSINDGNLLHGILDAEELLDAAGNVLPVTLAHTTLCAELADGTTVCGESEIDRRGSGQVGALAPIGRVFLQTEAQACADTVRAIRRADLIVLGPGDLYTSILPNFLVEGIAEAVSMSEAQKVYVCNLMTKHGETDGFRASDFVREVMSYLGHGIDRVVLHDGSIDTGLLERYACEHQEPVEPDTEAVRRLVPDVVTDQLVSLRRDHLIRHDPERLIRAIFSPRDHLLQDGLMAAEVTRGRWPGFVPGDETSLGWRADDGD